MKTWYYADYAQMKIQTWQVAQVEKNFIITSSGFTHERRGSFDGFFPTWKKAQNAIFKFWQDEEQRCEYGIKLATFKRDQAQANIKRVSEMKKEDSNG